MRGRREIKERRKRRKRRERRERREREKKVRSREKARGKEADGIIADKEGVSDGKIQRNEVFGWNSRAVNASDQRY